MNNLIALDSTIKQLCELRAEMAYNEPQATLEAAHIPYRGLIGAAPSMTAQDAEAKPAFFDLALQLTDNITDKIDNIIGVLDSHLARLNGSGLPDHVTQVAAPVPSCGQASDTIDRLLLIRSRLELVGDGISQLSRL